MSRFISRQAQKLQEKLAKIQEELANATVEASCGGGAVTIVMSGNQRVKAVKISPDAVDPEDIGLLEDLVMTAVNEAIERSQELAQSRLNEITGGLKIPGLT